ncbi:hypothetical protein CerSpe_279150 [Prunus speciosa]
MFSPNSRWILSVVAFTCWHIWKARCKFVYNDIPIVPAATRSRACLAVSEFWNVTEKPVLGSVGMPIQISSPHPSHWLLPISSYVKINTDDSWKSGYAITGVGVIIRKIASSCIGGLAAQDIRFLKAYWAWVPHEANRSADAVPSLARKGMCLESWLVRPPSSLVHILSQDGLPCPRPGA